MTRDDVIGRLRAASGENVRAWAIRHGFARSFIYAVLTGEAEPSDRLCAAIGVERVVSYRLAKRQKEA